MNPTEIESALTSSSEAQQRAFQILQSLARLQGAQPDEPMVLSLLIRALEYREVFKQFSPLLNALLRETGLYPYADPKLLSPRDRLAFEFHKPATHLTHSDLVFHRVQAQVYWHLVEGENIILSAPTSFGKSLIIDALIDTGQYHRIALVVPTIALIDETRKRLSRFSDQYKIITHASQHEESRRDTIFVLTQERVIERNDLDNLDLFVIDEFYKLSPDGKDDRRAAILNHALYKLLKTARQFYFLGPNIRSIPIDFQERYEARLIVSDFVTVATNVRRVKKTGKSREAREEALVNLTKEVDGSTLVYCQSPASVRRVASLMVEQKIMPIVPELSEIVEWVGENFHPEWIVARALAHGVGVHHGRLPRALAQLQVRLFNSGMLKFLVCTSTLIEGVNTAAKHVIIYDNKIAKKPIDYFTYRNIQGRSGRMFRHFIGTVHLFHDPPQPDLLDVDFPVFSQTEAASDGLLVQLDENDLRSEGSQRVNSLRSQSDLSMETIRANAHIEPQQQIELARHIRLNFEELYPYLAWRGWPSKDQIYKICELLFDSLLSGVNRSAVRSHRHLAFLLTRLQELGASAFISEQAFASGPRVLKDPSERVENALEFLRTWASFYFPRALSALELIQREVFGQLGLAGGSYSAFAVRIEHLMLPSALAALDEYGLPLQLVDRIQGKLPVGEDLDAVLDALKCLDIEQLRLGQFEAGLLEELKRSL